MTVFGTSEMGVHCRVTCLETCAARLPAGQIFTCILDCLPVFAFFLRSADEHIGFAGFFECSGYLETASCSRARRCPSASLAASFGVSTNKSRER